MGSLADDLLATPTSWGSLADDLFTLISQLTLQQVKVTLLQKKVKLLVIDSMAALISGECELSNPRQHTLGWHISFLKSLAELSRIPIVVTNQVRSQSQDGASLFSFQRTTMQDMPGNPSRFDSHLIVALGIHWAHAVSIRLILESRSGQRFMKIAKSPMSPPLEFQYEITSSGISLLSDNGVEVLGPHVYTIRSHGLEGIADFGNAMV